MKIAVFIITDDHETLRYIERQKAAIIPNELHNRHTRFNVIPVPVNAGLAEFSSLLIKAHNNHNCVGLLIESAFSNKLSLSQDAVYLREFCSIEAKRSYSNYFSHHLNRWLKNLIFICKSFSDGKMQKCLMLPLKNFSAPELSNISELITNQNLFGTFIVELEMLLKRLRSRNIPKNYKTDKRQFLKDDSGYFFELGKEHHGKAETNCPPHNNNCILTAFARFGISIDRQLHFNVSQEEQNISGNFVGCHNEIISVDSTTHVNMFPNGSIR